MSSVGSNSSKVSFRGEEIDLDDALRELYKLIQDNLNQSQLTIRTLSLCEDRNDTFIEALEIYHNLDDYVDCLLELFTELKDVSKQCLGKCPPEHREEFKKLTEERKLRKKMKRLRRRKCLKS